MKIVESLAEWRGHRRALTGSVGLVPTMGALHAGHRALLAQSLAECDHTVLTIFVNATQFNNAADLEHYPRTLEDDLAQARDLGVDWVLTPAHDELYPDNYRYRVQETAFSNRLCGAHRPGHFDGVLTVVMKLLNLVRPTRAYFGEKDFQQYLLIRDMAEAFFLDVDIVPCATVRDADGLALSSRNALLDDAGRRLAPLLNEVLRQPVDDKTVLARLTGAGFDVDYVESHHGRRFAAAIVGCADRTVRLIDNVPLADQQHAAG